MSLSQLDNPGVESKNALNCGSELNNDAKVQLDNIRAEGFSRLENLNMANFHDKKELGMSLGTEYTQDVYDNSGYKNGSHAQAYSLAKVAIRQMLIDAYNAKLAKEGLRVKTYINPNKGYEGCRAVFSHNNHTIYAHSEGFSPQNDREKEKYLNGFMETTGAPKLDNWRTVYVMPNLYDSNPSSPIGDFSHIPEPSNKISDRYGDSFRGLS